MKAKVKKIFNGRVVKMEGGGDIKEVLINTDILNPDQRIISICFKPASNSKCFLKRIAKPYYSVRKFTNSIDAFSISKIKLFIRLTR